MAKTVYRAGQDKDAWCGNAKCKMVLAHVIHAVSSTGRPAKVECKTCGAIHGYRAKEPGTTPTKAGTRRTRQNPEQIFEALIEGKDISKPVRYTIRDTFEKEMIIDHKKFGLGFITAIRSVDKIEVTFREGAKILIQGREA
jgi:hypothetical protein